MQTSVSGIKRREFLKALGYVATGVFINSCSGEQVAGNKSKDRPNILFCISDDQTWLHAGAYGDKVVKTPNFDRVAKEGVLFMHAFCTSPSCSPSRAGVLSGLQMWQLEEGGILYSSFPKKFKVYPEILGENGYEVGFTGKGWGPGNLEASGLERNPAGPVYYDIKRQRPEGISNCDYSASFEEFFKNKDKSKPFCFWFGCSEPHRPYKKGIGLESGKKIEDVVVPGFLPDKPEVRSDILDYYYEIEHFDKHLGKMLDVLEKAVELDNTIVVVTSDNGMPFPYAKTNLYDAGVRMPLAVRWGAKVKGGRVVNDFVSLADMAPTFLECAGVKVPTEMTARSIKNILLSGKSGWVEKGRDKVCTGIERHTWCRPGGVGYPIRAIRTYRWLYIRNYQPDRWPAGGPDFKPPYNKLKQYWQIDESPTKEYILAHKDEPDIKPFFDRAFGKRPAEELYDVSSDPAQINNVAYEPAYEDVKIQLRKQLEQYQKQTNDPRIKGESPWDDYPFYYMDYWKLSPLIKNKK